jgi:hypothetical protein
MFFVLFRQGVWPQLLYKAGLRGGSKRSCSISCQWNQRYVLDKISTSAILVLDELLLPTDLHLHINWFLLAASIFAYGQTSSGKTYTMTGITEYSVMDIYDYIEKVCVCLRRILF